jgi:hypothetical protein
MSVSPRVQCALIAVALLPCVAAAQSSPLAGSTVAAGQLSATPIVAPVGAFDRPPAGDVAPDLSAVPAPNLVADPIPTDAPSATSAPSPDAPSVVDGPTSNAATSGFHAANEQLTQKQLAERANHRDDQDGDNRGLGRDAVLMIIGGAAIVAGAIVGGGGGTALIVVGAVIGITGLVLILSR